MPETVLHLRHDREDGLSWFLIAPESARPLCEAIEKWVEVLR
jgi:hypothetical protein